MPVVTVGNSDDERYELKTAPPDGFVVLRRMSYGESLQRDAISTKFTVDGSAGTKDFMGDLKIDQERVALFDFAACVVEHNLTDANNALLNFKKSDDVRKLDKRVGQEIGKLIDNMNNFEVDDDAKN